MTHEIFGSRLRRLRVARGMTTKRLALLVGVTPSYLTQIQKGNREPPEDLFARLARAMALDAGELLELKRVLTRERILRAIDKPGVQTEAAALAVEILETDDGLRPEAEYRVLREMCSLFLKKDAAIADARLVALAEAS
ncbi:XRE family transcriptional regulator [Achromobacter spanius]|uniref:helix-turn-helix domain-containing protein n=1 Tax=Achromobacter spanius TaxID=217203 RepID=UPI000F8FB32F|nr:helix-turn-helix transcriptional regulator [Achromobacter spanius]AZS81518.1 XRE family transcriptional regulator [Achromobacter spanius]